MNDPAALDHAIRLLADFHTAQAAACDADGEVADQYAFDAAYSDFGEDAIEALERLVDALTPEPATEEPSYPHPSDGYEIHGEDEF